MFIILFIASDIFPFFGIWIDLYTIGIIWLLNNIFCLLLPLIFIFVGLYRKKRGLGSIDQNRELIKYNLKTFVAIFVMLILQLVAFGVFKDLTA